MSDSCQTRVSFVLDQRCSLTRTLPTRVKEGATEGQKDTHPGKILVQNCWVTYCLTKDCECISSPGTLVYLFGLRQFPVRVHHPTIMPPQRERESARASARDRKIESALVPTATRCDAPRSSSFSPHSADRPPSKAPSAPWPPFPRFSPPRHSPILSPSRTRPP